MPVPRSIEPGAADPRQFAHVLDTQTALHRHHFPDLFVDAVPPELLHAHSQPLSRLGVVTARVSF